MCVVLFNGIFHDFHGHVGVVASPSYLRPAEEVEVFAAIAGPGMTVSRRLHRPHQTIPFR